MDQLLRIFDLFNATAKSLAVYLPQSGPELLNSLKKLLDWGLIMDAWIGANLGVSIRVFLTAIGKIIITSGTFLIDLLQEIVKRIQ